MTLEVEGWLVCDAVDIIWNEWCQIPNDRKKITLELQGIKAGSWENLASQERLMSPIPTSLNTSTPFLSCSKNQLPLCIQFAMVSKWPSHLPMPPHNPSAYHPPTQPLSSSIPNIPERGRQLSRIIFFNEVKQIICHRKISLSLIQSAAAKSRAGFCRTKKWGHLLRRGCGWNLQRWCLSP